MTVSEKDKNLSTVRLVLEPLLPSHAAALFAGYDDDRMWRFMPSRHRPASVAELEQRFTRYVARKSPDGLQTWLNYAVRDKRGQYVGWVQATIEGTQAMVGYSIFADHWRQGYGAEACAELICCLVREYYVEDIVATVDTGNVASIRLLETLGFIRVWTGASEDMPGCTDHRYEFHPPNVPGAARAL